MFRQAATVVLVTPMHSKSATRSSRSATRSRSKARRGDVGIVSRCTARSRPRTAHCTTSSDRRRDQPGTRAVRARLVGRSRYNTAIASPPRQQHRFAIAISSAEPTLARLESGRSKPAVSGFLGVEVESVTSDLAAQANLDVTHGVRRECHPASPADKAGIRVGDVIVKSTRPTSAPQALTTAVKVISRARRWTSWSTAGSSSRSTRRSRPSAS